MRAASVPEVYFAVPGDLQTPTGGYIYDRRVIGLLPEHGWQVRHLELPGDYPEPSAASLKETGRIFSGLPHGALLVIDGLAFGAMPDDLVKAISNPIVALVHHPLALETGISKARAAALAKTERAALARAVHAIVTSPATAELLVQDFGVTARQITTAEPGTEPAPRARGSDGPPCLLSVGSVTARKGYDTLIAAFALIADLPWQSRIAGSIDRDKETLRIVREAISRAGLGDRVALTGSLSDDALAREYDSARLFVLPSHFEGYGMAFAEALARGLPVVACAGSAVSTTVPADAGILVPPGDPAALAGALRKLLTDPVELVRRADAAWRHAGRLPRWNDTAHKFAQGLERARQEITA
jgi:glycosyltransferase involved in cell wall biosynthesis